MVKLVFYKNDERDSLTFETLKDLMNFLTSYIEERVREGSKIIEMHYDIIVYK